MALESSQRELQFWFKPCPDQTLQLGDMSSQSFETPTRDNFGTPTWESREKKPFECGSRRVTQIILYGRRWWLPRVRAMLNLVCQSARGLSQHPRVFPNTN